MASRCTRRWAGVAVVATLALGCASTEERRQAEVLRLGEAAVDKAAYADELALFDQKQIAMAQIVLERSEDPAVRALATRVAHEHVAHLGRLEAWAQAKAVELGMMDLEQGMGGAGGGEEAMEEQREQLAARADERIRALEEKAAEARADLRALGAESGEEFERAYLAQLVEEQRAGLKLVERGRREFKGDGALATLLTQTEPVLEKNVKSAQELGRRVGE
ncbi:MAG: DUF4142 domain-containing protein [Myxococcaceae bacterium]|nr:DUF4142 domain-containing protein [Myxococcaceae bacterium]MCI0670832.1 DUF4142 domain-containing protein [Myxococcaceae bacterium]